MWVEIFLFFFLLLIYLVIKDRKPSTMPPGPFEIPFFGRLPLLDGEDVKPYREIYGDIITLRTGPVRSVILFDYKTCKEVMAGPDFVDRPAFFLDFSFDDQKKSGIIGSNGHYWVHDRRFALRNLRNLGMGKSYLEEAINFEAKALVEDLAKYNNEPICFPDSFRTITLNIIWQMVAGKRYDLRSKEVDSIYEASKLFREQNPLMFLPMFVPILKKLPQPVKNLLFKEHIFDQFMATIIELVDKTVESHEKNIKDSDDDDLINEYLREMEEHKDDPNSQFRRGALRQIINDLFQAGSDTVNVMMRWVVYLLARYPDSAAKLRQHIDDVVPMDRFVSVDDKHDLPLIESFITETLRYSAMVGLGVQHAAVRDTTIGGYFIPKGTHLMPCEYSIHFDPKYWNEPNKFKIDRFIDSNGKFQAPKEGFLPFGTGKRQCLGESLARMEMFLFTSALIQNFDIIVPEGVTLKETVSNKAGLRYPYDDKLIYSLRKSSN